MSSKLGSPAPSPSPIALCAETQNTKGQNPELKKKMWFSQSNNPHGVPTFGKLASMKLVDRLSCYVVGLDESSVKSNALRQFGPISSVRLIQNTNPCETLVRYLETESAVAAIEWCRRRGLSADHGYNKYCIKFINNKQCKRPQCPHRHSWCPDEDVMERRDQIPVVSKEVPPRRRKQTESALKANDATLVELRTQFVDLQRKLSMQHNFIQSLMSTMEALRDENRMLRADSLGRVHYDSPSSFSLLTASSTSTPSPRTSARYPARERASAEFDEFGLIVEEVIRQDAPF